jgi:hypothetical protein
MSQEQENQAKASWKSQLYILGTVLGAILGLFSAYLFAGQAEEDAENDERPKVSPIILLGMATSILSLVRQIAETGKKPKELEKGRKK